ncbi:40-kDa huntingtin-associated protein-like [Uloborus diversus]|uniref:40-kDa huntingtin-associated protein-like n=1 Tax=Uloborus diversus TaxID=327109 RepID=UPI0024092EB2|nr:40-kDa huntingtin-associated protein-like [Uloborus diversus]
MDPSHDFLAQYKAITSKLKKRFLRKPNVAEASAQFSMLAKELQNRECPHYAAFVCLAVCRCEHSVGNPIFESQNLLHAAKLFLEAEQLDHELLCPGYSEHLQASINAYHDCIKVHLDHDQPALAASLYLELGQALRQLGRVREAIPHFLQAANLHRFCALDHVNDLTLVYECRIAVGDYDGALSALTQMQVICEKQGVKENYERIGAFTAILRETEITRLLLLLYLKPPPIKLKPEHAKLLDRYASLDTDSVSYIEEDLYLMLQSLMIAVNEKDEDALSKLEKDIWPYLSGLQNNILNRIVTDFRSYSFLVPYK